MWNQISLPGPLFRARMFVFISFAENASVNLHECNMRRNLMMIPDKCMATVQNHMVSQQRGLEEEGQPKIEKEHLLNPGLFLMFPRGAFQVLAGEGYCLCIRKT